MATVPLRKRDRLALVALLVLAAVLRVSYLEEVRSSPRFNVPTLDAAANLAWAEAATSGDWTSLPAGMESLASIPDAPYVKAPGYPWWLAFGIRFLGFQRSGLLMLQQMLGVLVVALVWYAARRWVSARSSWFAAGLAALHGPGIYYGGEFLDAGLLAAIVALAFAMMGRIADAVVLRSEPGCERQGLRSMMGLGFLSGGVMGLGLTVRPVAWPVVPATFLWVLWIAWRRRNPSRRTAALALMSQDLPPDRRVDVTSDVLLASLQPSRRMRCLAAIRGLPSAFRLAAPALVSLLLGVTLAVVPTAVRNARAGGGWLGPMVVGDSVAAYVGALPEYDGYDDADLGQKTRLDRTFDYDRLSAMAGTRSPRGIARYFQRQLRDRYYNDPETAGLSLARRLMLFWGPLDVGSSRVVEYDRLTSPILRRMPAVFPVVHALALFGTAFWLLSRWNRAVTATEQGETARVVIHAMPLLVVAVVVCWTWSHLPFLASGHWRLPMTPLLFFMAAWAFEDLCISVRKRNAKEVASWALTLLLLWLAVSQNIGDYVPNRAKWLMDQGMALEAQGEAEAARVAYRTVLMTTPGVVDPETGVALAETSLDPAAVVRFQKVASAACTKLGVYAAGQRHAELAQRYFREAEKLDPDAAEGHLQAGKALLDLGRPAEAASSLVKAQRIAPDNSEILYPLSQALYRLGRYSEARAHLEELLALQPDHEPARRLRALMSPDS